MTNELLCQGINMPVNLLSPSAYSKYNVGLVVSGIIDYILPEHQISASNLIKDIRTGKQVVGNPRSRYAPQEGESVFKNLNTQKSLEQRIYYANTCELFDLLKNMASPENQELFVKVATIDADTGIMRCIFKVGETPLIACEVELPQVSSFCFNQPDSVRKNFDGFYIDDLTFCDLSNKNAYPPYFVMDNFVFSRNIFNNKSFCNFIFNNSVICTAIFQNCKWENVTAYNFCMANVIFIDTSFDGCNFYDTNIRGISFGGAAMTNCNITIPRIYIKAGTERELYFSKTPTIFQTIASINNDFLKLSLAKQIIAFIKEEDEWYDDLNYPLLATLLRQPYINDAEIREWIIPIYKAKHVSVIENIMGNRSFDFDKVFELFTAIRDSIDCNHIECTSSLVTLCFIIARYGNDKNIIKRHGAENLIILDRYITTSDDLIKIGEIMSLIKNRQDTELTYQVTHSLNGS